MLINSNLKRVLESGNFAVTAELGPPTSADAEFVRKKAKILKGYIDAFNVTDGQTAVVRMASWAACLIGKDEGLDPIVQMTARDRNRIALQMDVLGASALGIHNILCLTGDHMSFGNHREAKGVWDFDSINFIKAVKQMRDEKKFQSGDEMDVPDNIVERMQKTPKEDRAKEGLKIAVETIHQLREIKGVAGVHIMAIEWEEAVPEIVEMAGLHPRP